MNQLNQQLLSLVKIHKMNLLKVSNLDGDNFYLPVTPDVKIGGQIKLNVKRYDLLSIDNIINDRMLWFCRKI